MRERGELDENNEFTNQTNVAHLGAAALKSAQAKSAMNGHSLNHDGGKSGSLGAPFNDIEVVGEEGLFVPEEKIDL